MASGRLVVQTYLANDAIPVTGALVRVEGEDEGYSGRWHSRFTDIDGITDAIILPTPQRGYSMAPGAPEQPYANYRVTVLKDGYYTKTVSGVAIFDGVTTLLPVNMIQKIQGQSAPEDTLDVTSYENSRLE